MDMKMPVDFERLPPFRQLVSQLQQQWTVKIEALEAERIAIGIWVKLWIAMAYQAQENNEPGMFAWDSGVLGSVAPANEDKVLGILTGGTFPVLEPKGDGMFYCERFAKLNPHLAGNYVSKERKGAVISAVKRSQDGIERRAVAQASLLPGTIYKDAAGQELTSLEVRRVMVLIAGLDNILKAPIRQTRGYAEGLIADAASVVKDYDEDQVRAFLEWIALSVARGNPVVPKRTEEVLKGWKALYGGMSLMEG